MLSRGRQLDYFVAVAQEGQITRAAQKLHLAQPALSQAIAQLERDVGVELLERHGRGVTLTPAGEAFLEKARAALAAEADAVRTAQALARAARGAIAVGFIGPPPAASNPELFAAFSDTHPDAEVSFQDLPFPRGPTVDWLSEVDVAVCHPPVAEEGVCVHQVRAEPRAVVAQKNHPLAGRHELAVMEVLDETFVSYHPEVQPTWAGFHCLDDHRGGPPAQMTRDNALTSLHMLGIMSSGRAITTVPLTDARLAEQVLPSVVAMSLGDARPAEVSLVWRRDNQNPLIGALVATAQRLGLGADAA